MHEKKKQKRYLRYSTQMVRVYIESSIFKRNKQLTYFWMRLTRPYYIGWLTVTHQDLRRTHRNIQ